MVIGSALSPMVATLVLLTVVVQTQPGSFEDYPLARRDAGSQSLPPLVAAEARPPTPLLPPEATEECVEAWTVAMLMRMGVGTSPDVPAADGLVDQLCRDKSAERILRWPNGRGAWDGEFWWYPDGKPAKSGELWWYPGHKVARKGGEWFWPTGAAARRGGSYLDLQGAKKKEEELLKGACKPRPELCARRKAALEGTRGEARTVAVLELVWASRAAGGKGP